MENFTLDITRQVVWIDGTAVSADTIAEVAAGYAEREEDFGTQVIGFLKEWFDDSDTVLVHTSGSTGSPKPMWVEKERMIASAVLTCSFLGLHRGDTALLCMPLQYIAGKMVVVRALVAGMRLLTVSPCGHPLDGLDQVPDFAAMIPMQVYNSLQVPAERSMLQQVRSLIIGGGAVDAALADVLHGFPYGVWSTYGMTETLSHVALRRLNGEEASDWYTPLPGVDIRVNAEGALCILAPRVCSVELVTNDVAECNERGQFRILGRKDNIINSGGVKIQIEQVEELLRPHMSAPFMITAAPHPKFGEEVVMLLQNNGQQLPVDEMVAMCRQILPVYWQPKRIMAVSELPMTGTGKPDRATARKMAAHSLD